MNKRNRWIPALVLFFVSIVSVCVLSACGEKKKNITLSITPATWQSEAYTITNEEYTFVNRADGGTQVVFPYQKEGINITLYITANDGYIMDYAVIRALGSDYMTNPNYHSFAVKKEGNGKITIANVTEDVVLLIEQVRRASIFIYFDANGGTEIEPIYVFSENGQPVSVSAPQSPTKDNYKFGGWYIDQDCTELFDFSSVAMTENITLYAKWLAKATVTFDTMGGSTIQPIDVYESRIVPPAEPTKNNYKFIGWYTDAEYTTKFDFTTIVTKDMTLYARWVEGSTVTFDANGGSFSDQQQTVDVMVFDSVVSQPSNPSREKYRFDGWSTLADGSTTFDFNQVITADTILYAKWVEQITIQFETKTSTMQDQIIDKGSKITYEYVEPYIDSGLEYQFMGWALEENGAIIDKTATFTEDTTLYAIYEEITGYFVTYVQSPSIDDVNFVGYYYDDQDPYIYIPKEDADSIQVEITLASNVMENNVILIIASYDGSQELQRMEGTKIQDRIYQFYISIDQGVTIFFGIQ